MAGVSHKGSMGVRLSPSPINFIVVIVKKDHLCAAQVILSISSNACMLGRGGGGCRVGRRTTKQAYDPH